MSSQGQLGLHRAACGEVRFSPEERTFLRAGTSRSGRPWWGRGLSMREVRNALCGQG